MAKSRKKQKPITADKPTEKPAASSTPPSFWKRWRGDIFAVVAMYILTLILFSSFMGENKRFSVSGDAVAARAWITVGEDIDQQVEGVPAWNPYVFMGFPTYGSLAYHPQQPLNPANWIVAPGKFLFGFNDMNKQIFFYFLSGLLMFLFARGIGLPWWGGLLAGVTFMFNPYNISLAEAAHASKHWTITMIPLVLLLTHRMLAHRRLLDMGLLALSMAALLLSLHAQIAYYALLVSGIYALVWFIRELFRDRREAFRGFGMYAGGSIVGLGLSAYLYWPIYVFSKYSVRGVAALRDTAGPAGLDWEYATNWSLHPLESLQFIVPGLFGLGGSKPLDQLAQVDNALSYNIYWGWMPFTQSSLYMGIIPLFLAIMAVFWLWRKNGIVRWMTIAGVLAWIVSFGKYLPILYWPMYHLLPFFNKFRVPSMALVITAVAVAILAGFGLVEVIRRLRGAAMWGKISKINAMFMAVTLLGIIAFIITILGWDNPLATFGGFFKEGEMQRYNEETLAMLLAFRWSIFIVTLRIVSIILLIFGTTGLIATRYRPDATWAAPLLILVTIAVTAVDLMVVDSRFLHVKHLSSVEMALAKTDLVQTFQQDLDTSPEPYRIFPVSSFQDNSWMYHKIPSIGGYGPNKLRVYQDILDYALFTDSGQPNLNVAGMMNARFLITQRQLSGSFQQVFADERNRQYAYVNPFAMPRAWFVDNIETVPTADDAMTRITDPEFDASTSAVLIDADDVPATGAADTMRSVIVPTEQYGPQRFVIETSSIEDQFLVMSEIWYPQGWYAAIDGEPVEFRRVNYALRGLPVPAGEHQIEVWYDPPEIEAGFAVSWTSLVIALLLTLAGGYLMYRRRS